MHCNLKATQWRASHSGLCLVKFVLRMCRNCYFQVLEFLVEIITLPLASATPISCIPQIFWRSVDIYHVTLTFDLLTLNICCAYYQKCLWIIVLHAYLHVLSLSVCLCLLSCSWDWFPFINR